MFPLEMHKPIITSCSVGGGNTCMNKLFKELAVMYGPEVAEGYLHRRGMQLADLEAKPDLENKQTRERRAPEEEITKHKASPSDLVVDEEG